MINKGNKEIQTKNSTEILNYHEEIVEKVLKNIKDRKKVQLILLNNRYKRLQLSKDLALHCNKNNKNILIYTSSANQYIDFKSSNIYICDNDNIKAYINKRFSLIIIDSVTSIFDEYTIMNLNLSVKKAKDLISKSNNRMLSSGEKELIGLHYLDIIIGNSDSFVVNIEYIFKMLRNIDHYSIICSNELFLYRTTAEDANKYNMELVKEYDNFSQKFIEYNISKQNDLNFYKKNNQSSSVFYYNKESDNETTVLADILNRLLTKVEDVHTDNRIIKAKLSDVDRKVASIKKTVEDLNKIVISTKEAINIKSFNKIDDENKDLVIAQQLSIMTKEIIDKLETIVNLREYINYEKLMCLKMGKTAWQKMTANSCQFLISAEITFSQNLNQGNYDFSGVCLLLSKAFENEIERRFHSGCIKYLKNKGIHLPEVFLKETRSGEKQEKGKLDFSLGTTKYIIGKNKINSFFLKYCKDSLLSKFNENDIVNKLEKYKDYVEKIRLNYRNPAAHKEPISLETAYSCVQYILEVERVLKIMLEDFSF